MRGRTLYSYIFRIFYITYCGYFVHILILIFRIPSSHILIFLCILHDSYEQVDVTMAAKNNYCINVVLRCLAAEGDGLGPHELNDGGLLATVIASGFKGSKEWGVSSLPH